MDYLDELNKRKQRMNAESYDMAERFGISGGARNGKQDAFRHAYMSAKTTRDKRTLYARTMGTANEIKNEWDGRAEKWKENKLAAITERGNPPGEWNMDELNNLVGREIGRKANEEGWNDERIAQEVKKALDEGKLIDKPQEPDQRIITPTRPDGFIAKPETPSPSILDYYLSEQKEQSQLNDELNFWERIWGR